MMNETVCKLNVILRSRARAYKEEYMTTTGRSALRIYGKFQAFEEIIELIAELEELEEEYDGD